VSRRRRMRGQAGLTLMEILLALAIGAILMAPLGAWAYSTLRSGIVSRDELGRANATGLLNIYFLRDVASSRAFSTQNPLDCYGAPTDPPTRPVLRVPQSGDLATTVVYAVGIGDDPVPLYRHVCASDGSFSGATKVMGKVVGDSVSAACHDAAGAPVDCEQPDAVRASLRLRPWSDRGPKPELTVSGTRRTTGSGSGFATSNPPDPRLAITPSTRGYSDTVFVVESRSVDPDPGTTLSTSWTLPAGATVVGGSLDGPTVSFTLASSGQIVMNVSDGSNVVAGAVHVEIVNRPPVIQSVEPCEPVGGRTFRLSATVADPDTDDAATATWTDPSGAELHGVPAFWTAAADLTGVQHVQLTVSDTRGAMSQRVVQCDLGDAPVGGVDISPAPDEGGVINSIQPGGGLEVTFTAQDPGPTTIGWQLFRRGESSPVNSTSGSSKWTLLFSYAEAGEYEIVRVTDGVAGPRVGFRLNAQPTISLTSPGSSGQVPSYDVQFVAAANDPDGTVVATYWDFGDGTGENPAPAGSASHTYTTPGPKTVTFRAVDDDGAEAVVTLQITVPEGAG
jgi:prepilin-type N-terminal cleavage/methylation domain-containing protein